MVDGFIDWLAAVPAPLLYTVLIVLSALENVFPPVPADVAVALGAFLAQRGATSSILIGVSCWAANTASSAAMYVLARSHADFFHQGWPARLLPPPAMGALERAYARYGTWGIFFSRFLPGIRAAVTPFAGVVGLSPMRALVPSAAASAIWYAFLIVAGTALGREWSRVREVVERVSGAMGVLGLIVTALVGVWLWRQRRRA
jgi:membrane protein DedA with SNARE-associated domain